MERLHCEIREMRGDEQSLLLLIADEVLKPLAHSSGHLERYSRADVVALLEHAEVFVAECAGDIAGFVAIHEDDPALLVDCLCVSPAHEAQAVAHQLMQWTEGLAFNRRLRHIEALVPTGDERSLGLYRKHEFVPVPAADRPEMIVLEKRLPEVLG
jgi:ribosomal protein S18 acetylase RimI-like enzyme